MGLAYFHADFDVSRHAFQQAAIKSGFALTEVEVSQQAGQALTVCFAEAGDPSSDRAIVHISGTHGVEGFVGSAIQLAVLDKLASKGSSARRIFVHALNPWGMKNLRKANAENVDLNRNFIFSPQKFAGAPEAYKKLNSFLNPKGSGCCEFFLARALALIAWHGMPAMRQAVAGGQYEFEEGIFFGGRQLAAESRAIIAFLQEKLKRARLVGAIDVHSGLGQYGDDTLLVDAASNAADVEVLRERFKDRVSLSLPESSVAYVTSGGLTEGLPKILDRARVLAFVQEFGTYSALKVLQAMRDENRWHHRARRAGQQLALRHSSKAQLLEVFCPADQEWRQKVVERGCSAYMGLEGLIQGVKL
ncbi:MAG: DUF2817 domain-containing protein [Oligoflexia bacterium]|nr:DUF2817 domain-containing protein [Oligoflexia bacterium]